MEKLLPPSFLSFCIKCNILCEPIYLGTGYENCQFPTAYEDYYGCPVCKGDVISEYENDFRNLQLDLYEKDEGIFNGVD